MKLIIQIPCYNEEDVLPETIKDLPTAIDGIDEIEYLVIDDGSTDKTIEVAKAHGVHHVISMETNHGLAKTFMAGIHHAVRLGADIVVNTDGDNQYCGKDIAKLIKPILDKQADMVIGCRPIKEHKEFGPIKKCLQLAGSWALRRLSKISARDAASGFRAYSRKTCLKLNLYSSFSHCTESLIQAGSLELRVASVDIAVNKKTRESRLFKNIPQYLYQQGKTMLSMFILYRPGLFFIGAGSVFMILAALLGVRFIALTYFFHHVAHQRTYLPSLILLAIFAIIGIILWSLAIIGELIKFHRHTTQEILYLTRKEHYDNK